MEGGSQSGGMGFLCSYGVLGRVWSKAALKIFRKRVWFPPGRFYACSFMTKSAIHHLVLGLPCAATNL